MEINLIHFGDQCAPGIIIEDILKIKKKQLFMLGIYKFNDIIKYLQDNNLYKIYDKNYLEKITNNFTKHLLYNFNFNHDYVYNSSNIINYNFIKNRFNKKIENYKQIFKLNMFNIFINFTNNVNNLNINGFLQLYENNIKYHLIIFTNNDYKNINNKNISIIKLKNKYDNWWSMDNIIKNNLYKEIYVRFVEVISTYNFHLVNN